MRILTVRQPWAWAIIHGQKDVENRSRNIAGDYRGPVAIHAALRTADLTDEQGDFLTDIIPFGEGTDHHYPLGAIIGVVDLVGVHRDNGPGPYDGHDFLCCESAWAISDFWHLELANPRPLKTPIPAKGRLGLWRPGDDLEQQITDALEATA